MSLKLINLNNEVQFTNFFSIFTYSNQNIFSNSSIETELKISVASSQKRKYNIFDRRYFKLTMYLIKMET